jgi:hypothetical protein
MVSSFLLGMVQQTTHSYLTDRATVSREVSAMGEFGEQVRRWDVVMTDVPCRLIVSPFERNQKVGDVAGAESAPELYSVILPLDAVTVLAKDQLAVSGHVLRVVQVQRELTDGAFQRVQAVTRDE